MAEINLLPWRERKREQEKNLFFMMIFFWSMIAVILTLIMNYHLSFLIKSQNDRNKILQHEINNFVGQIKEAKNLAQIRKKLIYHIREIQNLQLARTFIIHLFDELSKVTPPEIFLNKIEAHNNIISIWGYAESHKNVSQEMKNIEQSEWLHRPILSEIKKRESSKQFGEQEFKLIFHLEPPNFKDIQNE